MTKLRWNDPPRESDPARAQSDRGTFAALPNQARADLRELRARLESEEEFGQVQKALRSADLATLKRLHDEATKHHSKLGRALSKRRTAIQPGAGGQTSVHQSIAALEAEDKISIITIKMIRDEFESRYPTEII